VKPYAERMEAGMFDETTRSLVGRWKHTYRYAAYIERKVECRAFGQRLAASGLMKAERRDWTNILRFAMSDKAMFSTAFCGSPIDTLHVLAGEDVGRAVRDAWKEDWESVWQYEQWYCESPYYALHGLHVSEEDPSQVAFAETLDKLVADRFTRCKPGRYLTRFFGDVLTEDQIRAYTQRFAARLLEGELRFIENDDPDGWVRVYRDGPSSCMQGEDCVKVYAREGNGLRLAYMQREGEIVARSIVRDDEKHYIRIYPGMDDDHRIHTMMKAALEKEGYTRNRDLHGIELRAIRSGRDDTYLMPYIDGDTQTVSFEGDRFVIGGGDICATNTCGTITLEPEERCYECNDGVHEEDAYFIEGEDIVVCEYCLERHFTNAIGRRGHRIWTRDENTVHCESDGEQYVEDHASDNGVGQCDVSGNWYSEDDLCQTADGMVHVDRCTPLDVEDAEGNSHALTEDVVRTHDGRRIREDESVNHGGLVYHQDDELPEDGEPDPLAVVVPYTGTVPGEVDTHTMPLPFDTNDGVNG
jgi:hypothetical protein